MSAPQPLAIAGQARHAMPQRIPNAPVWLQLWLVICGLFAVDLAWGIWIGLSISGWDRVVGAAMILLALSFAYQQRSRILADTSMMAALWIAVSSGGCVLTYLATTCALPLQDAVLMHYDHAIGFDWLVWRDAVARHPLIHLALSWAYDSLMLQILLACLLYPVQVRTRKSLGEMMRKLSVTASQ